MVLSDPPRPLSSCFLLVDGKTGTLRDLEPRLRCDRRDRPLPAAEAARTRRAHRRGQPAAPRGSRRQRHRMAARRPVRGGAAGAAGRNDLQPRTARRVRRLVRRRGRRRTDATPDCDQFDERREQAGFGRCRRARTCRAVARCRRKPALDGAPPRHCLHDLPAHADLRQRRRPQPRAARTLRPALARAADSFRRERPAPAGACRRSRGSMHRGACEPGGLRHVYALGGGERLRFDTMLCAHCVRVAASRARGDRSDRAAARCCARARWCAVASAGRPAGRQWPRRARFWLCATRVRCARRPSGWKPDGS